MDVEVHGLSGNLLCCLEVQAAQTVADLKELIHKATQIKTNLQKLLLGNELLRNTDSCGEILTQGAHRIRLFVMGSICFAVPHGRNSQRDSSAADRQMD